MEKKNNSGILVGVLIGIIIMLLVVGGLFLTGTISLKTTTSTDNKQNTANKQTSEDSKNEINPAKNNSTNEIDSALLNNLYNILGINLKEKDSKLGDCLNYFLSTNNYKENAERIFGIYASQNSLSTYHYNDDTCNDECKRAYSCAECSSIKKIDANKIIKLYNLDNLNLSELPGYNDEYRYLTKIPMGTCHYKVKHNNLTSQYIDNNTITITDNQQIIDYVFEEDNKVNSTKNQTVIYEFKKDNDGNYNLSNVSVK